MPDFITIQGATINVDTVSKINFGSIAYDQVPEGTRHVQLLLKNESTPIDYYLKEEEIKSLQAKGFLQQ